MKFFHRFHSLFRRSAVEAEMAEEMREHLEMQEAANRAEVCIPKLYGIFGKSVNSQKL